MHIVIYIHANEQCMKSWMLEVWEVGSGRRRWFWLVSSENVQHKILSFYSKAISGNVRLFVYRHKSGTHSTWSIFNVTCTLCCGHYFMDGIRTLFTSTLTSSMASMKRRTCTRSLRNIGECWKFIIPHAKWFHWEPNTLILIRWVKKII